MKQKRIQVYADEELKRWIELAAANSNVPVTAYGLQAITQKLAGDDLLEEEQMSFRSNPTTRSSSLICGHWAKKSSPVVGANRLRVTCWNKSGTNEMMNSLVCVDANIFIWSVVPFPLSAAAEALLKQWQHERTTLLALALLAFEVTARLRRLIYFKELTLEEGEEAFARFLRINIRLSHRQAIFLLVWHLAKQFNRPRAYDTAYLALAQLNHCEFWTADEKLYNAVRHQLPWVKWIGQYPLTNNGAGIQ